MIHYWMSRQILLNDDRMLILNDRWNIEWQMNHWMIKNIFGLKRWMKKPDYDSMLNETEWLRYSWSTNVEWSR